MTPIRIYVGGRSQRAKLTKQVKPLALYTVCLTVQSFQRQSIRVESNFGRFSMQMPFCATSRAWVWDRAPSLSVPQCCCERLVDSRAVNALLRASIVVEGGRVPKRNAGQTRAKMKKRGAALCDTRGRGQGPFGNWRKRPQAPHWACRASF